MIDQQRVTAAETAREILWNQESTDHLPAEEVTVLADWLLCTEPPSNITTIYNGNAA